MPFLEQMLDIAPDWAILGVYGAATAAIGLGVAVVARRTFRRHLSSDTGGLAENVHMTVLYFAMFVLALPIADARSNLSAATDIVEQEGYQLTRLDRQLLRYGSEPTEKIRADLVAYAHSVTDGGWKVMAVAQGETRLTRTILDRLADEIYDLEPATDLQTTLKPILIDSLDNLDKQRELRLEKSTTSTPTSFWIVISVLIFFGMVLCGRYRLTKANLFYLVNLLAAFGIGMAFLAILDEPFRGETSVSKAPLLRAAAQIQASLPPQNGGPSSGPNSR